MVYIGFWRRVYSVPEGSSRTVLRGKHAFTAPDSIRTLREDVNARPGPGMVMILRILYEPGPGPSQALVMWIKLGPFVFSDFLAIGLD